MFPVADGDTGDNMALTMRAVLDELDRMNGRPLDEIGRDEIVDAVARAALLGARGNSGVILSQIVRGAAEELASRAGRAGRPGARCPRRCARAADAAYALGPRPGRGHDALRRSARCPSRVAHDLAHMDTQRLGPARSGEEQDALIAEVLENALEAGRRRWSAAPISSPCCGTPAWSTPAPTA